MRSLYIHENMIEKIEGLDTMTDLRCLNLSDNLITYVSGLSKLVNLDSLQLKRNRIGKNGIEDVIGLLECPSLTVVDLSDNFIEDPEVLPQVFEKMPNLAVLYLNGNGVTKNIRNYRKTLISRIPTLKYLDDRPVFPEDRRAAEAFARGGLEEERKERKNI